MNRESNYWIVVLLVFIYLLIRYRKNSFYILIILFFFEGLFTYYGKISWNFYKIFLPGFAFYILIRERKFIKLSGTFRKLLITFLLFSIFFFISSLINKDDILLFLNQYSRYLLPFLSFLLILGYIKKGYNFGHFDNLILKLLNIQILLSILNFFLMGLHENIVGSIGSTGGSAATIIPILGFIFIWLKSNGNLKRKEWIYFLLLLLIGFVSIKRAIWMLAPAIAMLLVYYVPPKKIGWNILILTPLIPLIFYIGIRLNPTLNKEGKVWGEFDFEYVYDYSLEYTFGNVQEDDAPTGRGGATLITFESILSGVKGKALFGSGLSNIYAWNERITEDPNSPVKISSLNSITMATGIFQNYYTGGIFGVISFMLFMIVLFSFVRNIRFRIVLILLFLWEYLLYANTLMRIPALSFMLVYLVLNSNKSFLIRTCYTENVQTKIGNIIP